MRVIVSRMDHIPRAAYPKRSFIKTCLDVALEHVPDYVDPKRRTVGLRFVDVQESETLNQQFRGIPKPTNVLSFSDEALGPIPSRALGDLVMCPDVVHQEVCDMNLFEEAHWAHLLVHGFLHLLGYDHETERDAWVMERLEIKILIQLNYSNPYLTSEEKTCVF